MLRKNEIECIDIKSTIEKYEYPKNGKSYVVVICQTCNETRDITLVALRKSLRSIGVSQCKKCMQNSFWYKEKQSKSHKEKWKDPNYAKRQSDAHKKQWEDPKYREKILNILESQKEKTGKKSKELWQNGEYRELQSKRKKELWQDPKYIEKQSEKSKKLWKNEQYREKVLSSLSSVRGKLNKSIKETANTEEHKSILSLNSKKLWEDDKYRKKHHESMLAYWKMKESRELASMRMLELWKNKEYKEKMLKAWSSPDHKEKRAQIRSKMSGKSSLESVTSNILESMGIEHVNQQIVGPYVFDHYIPSSDMFIECQGEYWHSLPKMQKNDAAKFSYLEKARPNSKIVYLHEREFLNPGAIRQKLSGSINQSDEVIDFSFSDLEIKELDQKKKENGSYLSAPRKFLNSFHYAQYGRHAKIAYGAFHGEQLIAVCKFSIPVRREVATSLGYKFNEVLELDRFCIHPKYQKKNFASWFISKCVDIVRNETDIICLVSFADSTFGHHGTIYKAANWEKHSTIKPDYYYVSNEGWVMHKKTLWDHARSMKKTEKEYAEENRYEKIFGKEKTKFIYKL